MNQKHSIGQKVLHTGKQYIVIATKEVPYEPLIHPYDLKARFPEKDYLIIRLKSTELSEYSGIIDVWEHEINIESIHN